MYRVFIAIGIVQRQHFIVYFRPAHGIHREFIRAVPGFGELVTHKGDLAGTIIFYGQKGRIDDRIILEDPFEGIGGHPIVERKSPGIFRIAAPDRIIIAMLIVQITTYGARKKRTVNMIVPKGTMHDLAAREKFAVPDPVIQCIEPMNGNTRVRTIVKNASPDGDLGIVVSRSLRASVGAAADPMTECPDKDIIR